MYTMVIADDEAIERKALGLLMQKNFPDIEVVGRAENGIELVSMVEILQPDMAIVDVSMPGMSGIDAIDLLYARNVTTRFVINTAYSEFDYVQRALTLKIDAYILKPGKQESTIGTVRKLCRDIDAARENSQSQRQVRALFGRIAPVMESEILYSIFIGEAATEDFEAYCEMHALNYRGGAMVSLVPTSERFVPLHGQDKATLRRILGEALGSGCTYLATIHKNSICLLVFSPAAPIGQKPQAWLTDLLHVALDRLYRQTGLLLRAGVGHFCEDFGQTSVSYQESLLALQQPGKDNTAFYDAALHAEQEPPATLAGAASASNPLDGNSHVRQALLFIEQNFHRDISLDSVAQETGLSLFYLSRLIKQDLGQTFIEYLTRVRMEEAQRLAKTTRLSIREIARLTGYRNSSYFCRVFKKHTGQTIGSLRNDS